jgi:hypothetical protein
MASLSVQLTAPNGRVWSQPTGLFINNQWVKSSDGDKIATINPAYVLQISLSIEGILLGVFAQLTFFRAQQNC